MKIQALFGTSDPTQLHKLVSAQRDTFYDSELDELKKEWNVSQHKVITDKDVLPDKEIKNAQGQLLRTKKVNRISIPYQKMIVNRAVSFGFANEINIGSNADLSPDGEKVLEAIQRVLYENKEFSFNREVARDLYRAKKVAEMWYFEKTSKPHDHYGFNSEYRIRCIIFSEWKNNKLIPVFDDYDNLVCFSREFVSRSITTGKDTPVLEIWTDEEYIKLEKSTSGWVQTDNSPVFNGKIPIIYAEQDVAEWEDVRTDIERLELLLSRHAEINDYHASPKTFVKGELKSMPQAGESNGILKGGIDSDVKILSWQDSPESIKLEIETRLENIHKFTQTADISFKSIKALNQVSGVMLKMLFMDVELKIAEKNELWDKHFTRRYNVIKSMLAYLNNKWSSIVDDIELYPLIKPFEINDEKEIVESLMTANGNLPIISHRQSVIKFGAVDDIDEEMLEIEKDIAKVSLRESTEQVSMDDIPADV